jgi:hypothetical protein
MSFLDLKSFRDPFSHISPPSVDVPDRSVHLVARYRIIPVMIFEALMNFNPNAPFVGEKLDHIMLFNHMNKILLAEPIR